jgi:hypothetical protein
MTDLERFLRLATWSLWGAQKRTVRMELESHIAHKTWKYQTRGFSESEALQKALVDLGQPHVISAGMTGVYTMPTLFRNTVLVGLLLSLGITTFQSSAQVEGTNRVPIQPCLESTSANVRVTTHDINCEDPFEFFFSLEQLKADLEPKGVKFESNKGPYTKGYDLDIPILTFPQGKPVYITQGGGYGFKDIKLNFSKDYVRASTFLTYNLPKSGLPVILSGWDKPVVSVGETQFDISFSSTEPKSQFLYGSVVFTAITELFRKQRYAFSISYSDDYFLKYFGLRLAVYRNNIQINADSDSAYVLVAIEKTNDPTPTIISRVLRIENNRFHATGQLKNLEFVDSWDKLKPIAHADVTNLQRSGTVILARVNTKLNDPDQILEIINPNEIRVSGSAERLIAKDTTQSSFCKDKGGANTTLSGRWIGELQSFDVQGQKVTGKLNNKIQPNGVYEGLFESRQTKSSGMTLGAFCNNNEFTGSLEYESPRFAVNTSTGSIKQITPTLIEGSSIERDESNNIIGRTYFRLRKQ